MKKFFCTLLLALTTALVYAVPAKPGLTKNLTLTDGTTVRATLVGDEYAHYWQGADGKTYQSVAGTETYRAIDVQAIKTQAQVRRAQSNARRMKRLAPRRVGAPNAITGKKKGLIILVNFSNVSFKSSNNNALYQRIANEENFSEGSFKGSMRDYFYAQSEGQFELDFDVVGPVKVSKTQAYYGSNDDDGNDLHPAEMVIEALKLANSQVNYADYDWDGDGEVEQVYVVYAGKGEADGGAASTIWPHEFDLYSANYYGDGSGAQKLDGVTVNTYACGAELDGYSGSIAGIGTMCHEFSHCLGYPDFYDTDYSGGQGMYSWDLMDNGSYNGDGYQPAGFTSYERWVAGWKSPVELTTTQTVSGMKALQNGGESYVIYNKGNRNEYFLLENRQKTGWDASLPGKGLLILHVDYDADVWANNQPNDDPNHQRMTWIPADNKYQYESYQGSKYYTDAGLANDPYPYGSRNAFSRTSTPAAMFYNKNADGTYYMDSSVEGITQNSDGTISFSFKGVDGDEPGEEEPAGATLLYEGVSQYTSTGDGTAAIATSSSYLDYSGWSSLTKIYTGGTSNAQDNGGCLKFGTGSAAGSMTSGSIALTGAGTLTFYLKKYGSDTGKLRVSVTGATADNTEFTPGSEWALCTVNLTEATGSVTITLATSSKRAYVDEIRLVSSDEGIDPILAYYKNADGKTGAELKTAMSGIIYDRTEKSFDNLWAAFKTTDVRADGKIWDMYSDITNYEPVTSGSTYSVEGDCYNREHSFPQSWFGSATPMYTDLHHIYPTDGFVNGKRANYPFGETKGEKYKSANDFSKLGACTYPGYTGIVFEPADEYKGDFARTYFYMVTCYEEKLADWYAADKDGVRATIDGSTYPGLATWQLKMLLKWAANDPVSEKETARNNAVYAIQKNRNPFIDYPGLEQYIWGSMSEEAFSYDEYVVPSFDEPTPYEPTAPGTVYKLVASTDKMVSGVRYIIACGNKATAAGQLNGSYLDKVDVTATGDLITLADDVAVFVLEGDQTNGWSFRNEGTGKYLYATGTKALAESSTKQMWTLSNGTEGVIMSYTGSKDCGTILYNVNSPRFTTYTSSPSAVMVQANLYMEVHTYELANDGTANGALISSHAGEYCNVTLSGRTLYKDGSWNTLCLPFDVTIADSPLAGATVRALTDAEMNGYEVSLTFSAVTGTLEAGKPYIIRWEDTGKTIEEPSFSGVTLTDKDAAVSLAGSHVKFIGYYDAFDITAADYGIYYMTADNTLKHTGIDRTLGACRAYFLFTPTAASGEVRDFTFSIDFDGEATAIGLTPAPSPVGEGSDTWYDLSGRRIANGQSSMVNGQSLQRGVYIVNGKKVLVK